MMNPCYTVFFAPAIEDALRMVGGIYQEAGFGDADLSKLSGRDLGVAVAESMFSLADAIGFPRKLADVQGFTDEHIERALTAAKNPQLKMKLQNMPVPLTAAKGCSIVSLAQEWCSAETGETQHRKIIPLFEWIPVEDVLMPLNT